MPESLEFSPKDFEHFRPELQRNPEYNPGRLEIRRKLDAFGKRLSKALAEKGVAFTSRASLHHPYRFNAYKVDSQFVYLSRAEAERKKIKSILGVDLGKDLDQNYVHVLLSLAIHQHGLELSLRIHQQAWWDGENLKRQCAAPAGRDAVVAALRACPAFALRVHDHRRLHACETMTAAELTETLKYYTPGEHWLHVEFSPPRDGPYVTDANLEERLVASYHTLLPLYKVARWSEANNHLFG